MYAMIQNDGLTDLQILATEDTEPRLLVRTIRIHVWIENPKGEAINDETIKTLVLAEHV